MSFVQSNPINLVPKDCEECHGLILEAEKRSWEKEMGCCGKNGAFVSHTHHNVKTYTIGNGRNECKIDMCPYCWRYAAAELGIQVINPKTGIIPNDKVIEQIINAVSNPAP